MKYWLLKSEPDAYSYSDLESAPNQRTLWDGVRNYQAAKLLKNEMQVGDLAFFYHSSCKVPAVVALCRITRTGITDPTSLDPQSRYYDPKSSAEQPRWITVEVAADAPLPRAVSLKELKQQPELQDMVLLNNGRLSVQPVSPQQWQFILQLAHNSSH
ncbi:EVE domain-containing protein [Bacterioplanoides pacificum]|uniref:EVE domain-containing protein n=1 Tax=Bacterioplanoides pacificum TaxID=1171596 RepID=A0ABV7VYT8_9GAMM